MHCIQAKVAFSTVIAASICILGTTILVTCNKSPTAAYITTTPLSALVVTSQIAGWELDSSYSDSVKPYNDATAGDFVDGGNVDYCGLCNGHDALKDGLATYFKNPALGYKLNVALVLDYGTPSAAKAEVDHWIAAPKNTGSERVAIPTASSIIATGFKGNGGVTVYAYINKYYFELPFQNYNDSTALAVADAQMFLNYYNSLIK
jgi:hypothetical protein